AGGGGVLDDLKLRVLGFGHDVLAVQLTVGHQLGHVLHHRVVGPDRVGGDDVNIGQLASDRNRLAAADQRLLFLLRLLNDLGHPRQPPALASPTSVTAFSVMAWPPVSTTPSFRSGSPCFAYCPR